VAAHGLAGSAGDDQRIHGAAPGRRDRRRLPPPARSGRGRRSVRGAAGFPDGRPQPVDQGTGVARTSPQRAGVRRPRRAGAADLGRDRLDPVQPAATTGGKDMTTWTTLVQAEELAAAMRDRTMAEDGLAIVDCRFSLADPAAGERDYR